MPTAPRGTRAQQPAASLENADRGLLADCVDHVRQARTVRNRTVHIPSGGPSARSFSTCTVHPLSFAAQRACTHMAAMEIDALVGQVQNAQCARALRSLTRSFDQLRRSTTSSSIPTCTRRAARACTCVHATVRVHPPRSARTATGWKCVCSFGGTRAVPCT